MLAAAGPECSVLVVLFLVFLCHVLACCSRAAQTTGGGAQHPYPWRRWSKTSVFCCLFFCFSANEILVFTLYVPV